MFKIGDRVKIVTYGDGKNDEQDPVGQIGVVSDIIRSYFIVILERDNGKRKSFDWYCVERELELVK